MPLFTRFLIFFPFYLFFCCLFSTPPIFGLISSLFIDIAGTFGSSPYISPIKYSIPALIHWIGHSIILIYDIALYNANIDSDVSLKCRLIMNLTALLVQAILDIYSLNISSAFLSSSPKTVQKTYCSVSP